MIAGVQFRPQYLAPRVRICIKNTLGLVMPSINWSNEKIARTWSARVIKFRQHSVMYSVFNADVYDLPRLDTV